MTATHTDYLNAPGPVASAAGPLPLTHFGNARAKQKPPTAAIGAEFNNQNPPVVTQFVSDIHVQPIQTRPGRKAMTTNYKTPGVYIEERKQAALEFRRSPELTNQRTAMPGDTLPFMCFQVYGDPRHYLRVAAFKHLDDFRSLILGTVVLLPPLKPEAVRR